MLWGVRNVGAFATLMQDGRVVSQSRRFMAPFKDLQWAQPRIRVQRSGSRVIFTSDVFVWGVCIDPDGEKAISDDMFDLLPGVPYESEWPCDVETPSIARCASGDPQIDYIDELSETTNVVGVTVGRNDN